MYLWMASRTVNICENYGVINCLEKCLNKMSFSRNIWVFFCQMNLFLTCPRKYPRRSAPTDLENNAWTLPPHVLKRNGESTANEWPVDWRNSAWTSNPLEMNSLI